MHHVKVFCIFTVLLHTLIAVKSLLLWGITTLIIIVLMMYLVKADLDEILKKNILIVTFMIFFNTFIFISCLIEDRVVDFSYVISVSLSIFFVFNILIYGVKWLGKQGFLYIVNFFWSGRLKLFFLLFFRAVHNFKRVHSHVYYQIQSRIDVNSRDRYLIPRYYVQNIIAKELYAFRSNQAALISRLPENQLTVYYGKRRFKVSEIILVLVIEALLLSNFLFQLLYL